MYRVVGIDIIILSFTLPLTLLYKKWWWNFGFLTMEHESAHISTHTVGWRWRRAQKIENIKAVKRRTNNTNSECTPARQSMFISHILVKRFHCSFALPQSTVDVYVVRILTFRMCFVCMCVWYVLMMLFLSPSICCTIDIVLAVWTCSTHFIFYHFTPFRIRSRALEPMHGLLNCHGWFAQVQIKVFEQTTRESDFPYSLVRVTLHASSIPFIFRSFRYVFCSCCFYFDCEWMNECEFVYFWISVCFFSFFLHFVLHVQISFAPSVLGAYLFSSWLILMLESF